MSAVVQTGAGNDTIFYIVGVNQVFKLTDSLDPVQYGQMGDLQVLQAEQ